MSRAHMQKGEHSRRLGKQHHRRRLRAGPKWAQAGRPSPLRGPVAPPFDLAANRTIYSPKVRSHTRIRSSSAAEEKRSLRDTISERRVVLVV
jgi:hypothetical protein